MGVEARIDELLGRMTLEEKILLLSGKDCMDTRSVARLGIKPLLMADGPHGMRWGQATCFPTEVAMGATWNTGLIHEVGIALARETQAKGRNVILGPCVNIHRTPLGGRNFESWGEDPFLAARMTVAYVKGVQSLRVGTSTKHFAVNNQEWDRLSISAEVDERTLHEIYLPAFKAAVQEADTWTVMAAYNRVNGKFCCANEQLLSILKEEWGFQGLVVSDWGAVHGTVDSARAGLDLEMPGPGHYFAKPLAEAADAGEVSVTCIDDKVRRILRVMSRIGLLDDDYTPPEGALDTPEHRELALRVAGESMVLLKNDAGTLPLNEAVRTLAVIGPNANVARMGGGGSSTVTPFENCTILQALIERCGKAGIEVKYALGCNMPGDLPPIDKALMRNPDGTPGFMAEYFDNSDLSGEPCIVRTEDTVFFDWGGGSPDPSLKNNHFSARWTGTLTPSETREYEIGIIGLDDMRLYLDGELLAEVTPDRKAECKAVAVAFEAGREYALRVEYFARKGWPVAKVGWTPTHDLEDAVALAASCDAAVVVGGLSSQFEGEGVDRTTLALPGRQDELIRQVAAANARTAVVLVAGTPIEMDAWIDRVPAVLAAWYGGQGGGRAVADILMGDTNPSGKLTATFPKRLADNPSFANYPGDDKARYAEGLWVGYRHYDHHDIEPLFPFGHGLSYTRFTYRDIQVQKVGESEVQVSCRITNTGDRAGREVVQLYVRDEEASRERPVKELKGFTKIELAPGASSEAAFILQADAFSFYDPAEKSWVLEPGRFTLLLGSSSRDIRLEAVVEL
ncbi:MAG: beta-glucosidase [Spartobacteria bacterium]|nr:beta-glucosidase [Spartobacteria bacterium]